jgi:hypothetical protein
MITLRKKYVVALGLLVAGLAVGMLWGGRAVSPREVAAAQPTPAPEAGLQAAIQAARYHVRPVAATSAKLEAHNPAQQFRATFTGEQAQFQAASSCQQPWQLGLKLKGYGYGTQLQTVSAGELSTQANRVEIKRTLAASQSEFQTPNSAITEWYVNTPHGIEQGLH